MHKLHKWVILGCVVLFLALAICVVSAQYSETKWEEPVISCDRLPDLDYNRYKREWILRVQEEEYIQRDDVVGKTHLTYTPTA